MTASLEERVLRFAGGFSNEESEEVRESVRELLRLLERGEVRAASPGADGWRVHRWVKEGILLAFRAGRTVPFPGAGPLSFADKDTLPPRRAEDLPPGVRIVPGGSSVRAGAYVAPGVTLMPPCYVNVGAYVGEGSMVDSHALIGSCAQVGSRVHVSAAAQIGGVLEPIGQLPVIVEDEALIGGNTGVYEGVLVRRRAVLATGVILTRSTPIYDLVRGTVHKAGPDGVLEVPEGATLVMGSRPARGEFARQAGLQISTPLIVKYRDASTDARTALEQALRP